MLELVYCAETQTAAVYDAGVVKFVEKDISAAYAKAAYDSEINLKSCAVSYRLLLSYKLCKFFFKFAVDVESSVEES